ncbi:phospholipase D family protein [Chloroflexota bacterium]
MVAFLNKDAAYSEIVKIVSKAVNELVLITPYIKTPDDLLERLRDMDRRGVKTIVACREKDLKPDEKSELKKLKYMDLRYDEDLHAKCFYNEESMVITSLNLYQHSQQNNREMGILLNSKDDPDVFKEALNEAEFIVRRATKDSTIRSIVSGIVKEAKAVIEEPPTKEPSRTRTQSRAKLAGFCIRCGKSIAYDSKAPYCPDCYRVWVRFKDPDFEEDFCHLCGTSKAPTTMNKPICISCFRKSK